MSRQGLRCLLACCVLMFGYSTVAFSVLTPHRAYYRIKLVSKQQGSDIIDAYGLMTLEMDDVCEGWTIEQQSITTIQFSNRPVETLQANYAAWESKSGDRLKFYAKRIYNNRNRERVKGEAIFAADGQQGQITFTKPERATLPMNEGTLPPIKHLQHLIDSANNGDNMVSQKVFDGCVYGVPVAINTFIGGQKPTCHVEAAKLLDE